MMPRCRIFLAFAVALLAAGPAAAQPWSSAGRGTPQDVKDPRTLLEARASELIGKKVASPAGDELGEIEELIVDLEGGHMPHMILEHGAVREKLFVFPANAFTRDETRDRLVLNTEPSNLRQSQGFHPGNWPFRPPLARVSELRGRNVKDADGKALGEIEDLVVDMASGRVRHVVLAQDGRKGPEAKQRVPLASLSVPRERREAVVLKK